MKNLNFQIAKYFVVLCPVGFFPFAPRTIASLFAVYLGYLNNIYLGSIFTLLFAILTGILGWLRQNYILKPVTKKTLAKL